MFEHRATVRLHHTDAAGIIYFANQFQIAHDAFETFMEQAGLGVRRILAAGEYMLPIVHAESDFKQPLRVGDALVVQLTCERIGDTSFTLCSRLFRADGAEAGRVKIIHVAVASATWKKRPLPDDLRLILERIKGP